MCPSVSHDHNTLSLNDMAYTIDPFSIRFTETRHGVNATAKILRNEVAIGVINDFAKRIVTEVFFTSAAERTSFAVEARRVLVRVFGTEDPR